MFEIVERSTATGAISQIYPGVNGSEEDTREEAERMQAETDNYWYEVRPVRG